MCAAGVRCRAVHRGRPEALCQGLAGNGGDWGTTRYSTLRQITADNVKTLGAAWVTELPDRETSRAFPVISDGLMFVTTNRGRILALDPASGKTVWTTRKPATAAIAASLGEGLLFAGLADSSVVALDQKTGQMKWRAARDPALPSQAMTAQPVYGGGVVVATVSGGDNFARGRAIAFDAKSGAQLWVFDVVPGPGQPGHETWPKDSDIWKYGGGAIWTIPSIDADLGLVYIATGNAVPQFGGELRPGDNLYTDSVVALELKTGKVRWHYQLVHHDIWEHDVSTGPVLYDTTSRRAAAQGHRRGAHRWLFLPARSRDRQAAAADRRARRQAGRTDGDVADAAVSRQRGSRRTGMRTARASA